MDRRLPRVIPFGSGISEYLNQRGTSMVFQLRRSAPVFILIEAAG
jgi:hypothetical protein